MRRTAIKSKFEDPNLFELAKKQSPEQVSVIVELDLPERRIEFKEKERFGVRIKIPQRVAQPTPKEENEVSQRTQETRELLTRIVNKEPQWLRSARSFAVQATGPQLSLIAKSPLIKAIHSNRQLRKG